MPQIRLVAKLKSGGYLLNSEAMQIYIGESLPNFQEFKILGF